MITPSRRRFMRMTAGGLGMAAFARPAGAQQATGIPPGTVTSPPREWGWHAPPAIYPDPDVIVVEELTNEMFHLLQLGRHATHTGLG